MRRQQRAQLRILCGHIDGNIEPACRACPVAERGPCQVRRVFPADPVSKRAYCCGGAVRVGEALINLRRRAAVLG